MTATRATVNFDIFDTFNTFNTFMTALGVSDAVVHVFSHPDAAVVGTQRGYCSAVCYFVQRLAKHIEKNIEVSVFC